MRATEFIIERKKGLNKQAKETLPHGRHFHGADQYYNFYRLGIMTAGSPDHEHEAPTAGPVSDSPTMWAYSDVDEEMISDAAKKMGLKNKIMVQRGSNEPKGTHTVSPVANWMKKK